MRIETQRLTITRFTMDMAEAVHRNSLDEDNRRFVPDEVFETVEEAADTVEFLMGVYENGDGPLVYPVLLKDGTYIGYVQAVPFDDGTWEIGYHIGENYTRKGYATEAVQASEATTAVALSAAKRDCTSPSTTSTFPPLAAASCPADRRAYG